MSAEDLAALAPFMTETPLIGGQELFRVGDRVSDICFPSSAIISIVTPMIDGRSVESATVGFEGAAGLIAGLSGEPAASRVFAQVAGGAIKMPAAKLRARALASPTLMMLILRHIDVSMNQARQSVACNALHDLPSRLARWLLMTEDRIGGPVLPLTQEYLSMMLGVQRTTVTSAALSLKRGGQIVYVRGAITVVDRSRLEHTACECYATDRERFSRLAMAPHVFEDAAE